MDPREHWNRVWRSKTPEQHSWFQGNPGVSLELIAASGVARDAGIIDVGGGASLLVDHLLDRGYTNLTVLDLSAAALDACRARLGNRAADVEWQEADVTRFEAKRRYALWHDRAAFHFLTDAVDRAAYAATLRKALEPRGTVIIAGFALDGPPKCSGLDVQRHDESSLGAELGQQFQVRETLRETHLTPWQSAQSFLYCRFQKN